jgi:hypothetical protein
VVAEHQEDLLVAAVASDRHLAVVLEDLLLE